MKMRVIVLAAALVAAVPLYAQEPVVGVKDPESLFKDSDPKLNRNKQAALHIMRELLQCGQWDRAGGLSAWIGRPAWSSGRDAMSPSWVSREPRW